jgi:hypothetical protein
VALFAALATGGGLVALTPAAWAVAPNIVSVSPLATVGMGAGQSGHPARQITISVDNVATTDTVTVTFPGFTGLTATVQTPLGTSGGHTTVTALVSTSSSSAPSSGFNLTLTDVTTSSSDTNAFAIVAAPVVSSASPSRLVRGTTTTVTLTGTGMQSGVVASAPAQSGVTFGAVTVGAGGTSGTVSMTVGNSAPAGPLALTLTNPDAGWSTQSGAITIDTFVVSDVSPATASNATGNTSVQLTVTGQGIPSGNTTLKLTPTFTVTGQDPIVASPTSISASNTTWQGNVNLASAAAGSYLVQLVNGSEVGTLTSKSFTITSAAAPTVTTVTPSTLGQGADTTVTITGTNFARGAMVAFSKATFTTTGPVVFDSSTQLRVPVHVAASALVGSTNATNLTVTNTGGGAFTKTAAIQATTAPVIATLSPTALGQGAATTLTINGSNFSTSGTKAAVTFGTGVIATAAATITSTQIKVPVKVDPKASATASVKVQNPDFGTATASLPIDTVALTSVSPHYVAGTFSGNLVLTGSGLRTGATLTFPAGSGVSVPTGATAVATNAGTTLTVPVAVSRTTPLLVNVTVTNTTTDFGVASCTGCLAVAIAPTAPSHVVATKSGTTATVTWTQVTSPADGGAPISGYTVSVTAPANSGIATQSLPASSSSATFAGLDPNADYVFAIVATNAANLTSKSASATTSRQSRLTLSVSDRRIVAGRSIRVHGVLRDSNGVPIGGAAVAVHSHPDSGGTHVVGTVTTDSAGRWSVLVRPRHNAAYDAAFPGDAVNLGDGTAPVRVLVQPRLTINAPAVSSAGHGLVVHGRVSPDKSRQAVRLVAFDSAGRMHRLGTVFVDGRSAYRFSVPLGAGHWRLQVRIGRTGGNAAGESPRLHVVRD